MKTKIFNLTLAQYERKIPKYFNPDNLFIKIPGLSIWVTVVLLVTGVILNALNVIVFTRPAMKSVFNFLLAILEGINIVLYLIFVPLITRYFIPTLKTDYFFTLLLIICHYVFLSSACVSTWLTVTVSVFRLVAVTWPLASVSLCTLKRARYAVIGIVFVSSVILVTCLSFCYVTVKKEINIISNSTLIENVKFYKFARKSDLIENRTWWNLYYIFHVFVYTVPCFITCVLIIWLIIKLWSARKQRRSLVSEINTPVSSKNLTRVQNREERITLTLLIVVFLQLVAHVPSSVVYLHYLIYSTTKYVPSILYKLQYSKLLFFVCNCVTFLVYFVMSKRFRATLTSAVSSLKVKSYSKESNNSAAMFVSDSTVSSRL